MVRSSHRRVGKFTLLWDVGQACHQCRRSIFRSRYAGNTARGKEAVGATTTFYSAHATTGFESKWQKRVAHEKWMLLSTLFNPKFLSYQWDWPNLPPWMRWCWPEILARFLKSGQKWGMHEWRNHTAQRRCCRVTKLCCQLFVSKNRSSSLARTIMIWWRMRSVCWHLIILEYAHRPNSLISTLTSREVSAASQTLLPPESHHFLPDALP